MVLQPHRTETLRTTLPRVSQRQAREDVYKVLVFLVVSANPRYVRLLLVETNRNGNVGESPPRTTHVIVHQKSFSSRVRGHNTTRAWELLLTDHLQCDGGTPVCATCTAVYKTECSYDPESESRRSKAAFPSGASSGTKRDASVVTSSNSDIASSAEFIINSLRHLPEEHVAEFISHVRREPKADIATLAETWRQTVALPLSTPVDVQSLESDLSVLLGKSVVTRRGQSRHFGHSAGLGLVPEEESFGEGDHQEMDHRGTTWTNITNDLAFVERLFNLYFTWCHPFYVLLSRECFYKDFRAGRDKYCSPLLVNAICAYACHLTEEPAGRTDPTNFRTAGDHFFAEAKRLLFEDETPSLTTVQALCVMSMREPSTGRESSGFGYIGRCIRMCVELGLHLNNSASPALRLTPSEVEVRKVTFWGCFTVDS